MVDEKKVVLEGLNSFIVAEKDGRLLYVAWWKNSVSRSSHRRKS